MKDFKDIYGKFIYADGRLLRITRRFVDEDLYGTSISYNCDVIYAICSDGEVVRDYTLYFCKSNHYNMFVMLESLDFTIKNGVVTAIVKVDGKTYVGHAICSPNDYFDISIGERLALMRALKDEDSITSLIYSLEK